MDKEVILLCCTSHFAAAVVVFAAVVVNVARSMFSVISRVILSISLQWYLACPLKG